jgi:hypothetical protein
MDRAPGEALQRVCPSCSTVSFTADRRCPWCGASFQRRLWPVLLAVSLIQAALVLGGVTLLLLAAGDELDRRLDSRVDVVQDDLERRLEDIEAAVRQELDRRLPAVP